MVVYIAVSDTTLERLDTILHEYYKMNRFFSKYGDNIPAPKNYSDIINILLDEFIL